MDTLLSLKRNLTEQISQIHARVYFEYREAREGYRTGEKFMEQIKGAVQVAEVKYHPEQRWKLVWIFDLTSCHGAMADNALDVNHIECETRRKARA